MAEKLFLIDGMAFAFRSYYAIPRLSNSRGQPTNALYGFARVLLKILREHKPSHIIVVFDAPGKTFREDIYADYKKNRLETPPDLLSQLPLMDVLVRAFDIICLRVPGVEADDVIGTLARKATEAGVDTVVVTGDKDLLQLVDEHVSVYDPSRGDNGQWYGVQEVREKFGVDPAHVIDALALMGDASDNVPGVRGVGEKTAKKLLAQYQTVENLYAHLDELKGKQKERLEQDRDLAFLSRQLVTIDTHVDLELVLEDCRARSLDCEKLADIFADFEFQTLLEEFLPEAAVTEENDYRVVLTTNALARVVEELRRAGEFALDTETTSPYPMRAELVGVSLSAAAGKAYYVPVGHTDEAMQCLEKVQAAFSDRGHETLWPMSRDEALSILRPLLEDPTVHKIGHNIKYDLLVLQNHGIQLRGIAMDTMVASYLTDPSRLRHNLNEVSLQYLRRKLIPISDLIGKGSKTISFDHVPVDDACVYACEDADITWRVAQRLGPTLQERDLVPLFTEVELPLISVLARMERAGIAIDRAVFEELQRELQERLRALEITIFEEVGEPFQITSPKQLQKVLFEALGLRPARKTKTGYSTDVDVLEQLALEHPLPRLILEYRTLEKLRGTYVEALPKLLHPRTGRIHTSFNQAVAATGRLSSSDPNLQNIPVRSELGRRIRRGFVPGDPGYRLISADYSQIELRILAHLSGDSGLQRAFHQDWDIHADTAARVFGVAHADVTPEMRRQAKAVNFGVVYGISAFGLARNLGITTADAGKYIDHYFDQYPGVKDWIDHTKERARNQGYVTTLLNRRRYLTELTSPNINTRRAAERVAVNTPVQGTAADVIKVAMIRLDAALQEKKAQVLLQVHDELLVEAPADEADDVAQQMKTIMEEALALDVPLKVDLGIGDNWAEVHE
jgi:DNA polymerase I